MIGFDLSLFSADGSYKSPALSYLAMKNLVVNSPLRLSSEMVDASKGLQLLLEEMREDLTSRCF